MKATVNNATAFEVSSNINSKTVVLNDQSLPLDLLQNGAHLHFVWKGKSVNVEVLSVSKEEKKVVLKVNNKTTEVRLEEPLDALLNSLGFSSANSSKIKQVKSPMPGLVLSISAEVGKEIKKDEPEKSTIHVDAEELPKRIFSMNYNCQFWENYPLFNPFGSTPAKFLLLNTPIFIPKAKILLLGIAIYLLI